MMRLVEYSIVFFATLAGGILALVIAAAAISAPLILYKIQSPSAKSECDRIHPGMDLNEVKALIKKTPPYHEVLGKNNLMFVREDATCTIKFDPLTGKVSKVELFKHDAKKIVN